MASITFQNYFGFTKALRQTGTARPRAPIQDIYKREVVEVPTNMPGSGSTRRRRLPDAKEKFQGGDRRHPRLRSPQEPVLVGTVSIEKSEMLSNMLAVEKIPHQVLMRAIHERRPTSSPRAGVPGNVTVATKHAGRGTDIQLGATSRWRVEDGAPSAPRRWAANSTRRDQGAARRQSKPMSRKRSARLGSRRLYVLDDRAP